VQNERVNYTSPLIYSKGRSDMGDLDSQPLDAFERALLAVELKTHNNMKEFAEHVEFQCQWPEERAKQAATRVYRRYDAYSFLGWICRHKHFSRTSLGRALIFSGITESGKMLIHDVVASYPKTVVCKNPRKWGTPIPQLVVEKEEPPESFCCPITGEIMVDPVMDQQGHSYERRAVELWLTKENTSPMTRLPLTKEQLIPNRSLRDAIETHLMKK